MNAPPHHPRRANTKHPPQRTHSADGVAGGPRARDRHRPRPGGDEPGESDEGTFGGKGAPLCCLCYCCWREEPSFGLYSSGRPSLPSSLTPKPHTHQTKPRRTATSSSTTSSRSHPPPVGTAPRPTRPTTPSTSARRPPRCRGACVCALSCGRQPTNIDALLTTHGTKHRPPICTPTDDHQTTKSQQAAGGAAQGGRPHDHPRRAGGRQSGLCAASTPWYLLHDTDLERPYTTSHTTKPRHHTVGVVPRREGAGGRARGGVLHRAGAHGRAVSPKKSTACVCGGKGRMRLGVRNAVCGGRMRADRVVPLHVLIRLTD